MTDETELDLPTMLRHARSEMSDSEYRHRFRAGDFINYSPKQRELLNSTATALYAKTSNQFGKTLMAAGMATFQTTQIFPPWYKGWKQPKLNLIRPHSMIVWCFSTSGQMTRDGIQSRILGDVASGQIGTGMMPAENIVSLQMGRGIAGSVDSAVIRRADSSTAVIRFKSYEQGREAAQSESVDLVICDEMPTDMGLWSEILARTTATGGRILLTATPRKQQSGIAQWFKEPGHPERQTVTATIHDALHISEAQRNAMIENYRNNPLEAATRLYAADYAGGGLVFQTGMEQIVSGRDPSTFPSYWKWIIGLDPSHGGLSESSHPSAAVLCAYDPDAKVIYIVDCLRMHRALPTTLVASILSWPNGDAPVAWGSAENQGSGSAAESFAQLYKRLGLRMLSSHAEPVALSAGLTMMEEKFATGKLKVARHLNDWWEEFHSYERDENSGKPIAVRDDLMSATRYAVLMCDKHSRVMLEDRERPGRSIRGWNGSPHRHRDGGRSYIVDGTMTVFGSNDDE